MSETELTSKQKRRIKARALLKARTDDTPNAEKKSTRSDTSNGNSSGNSSGKTVTGEKRSITEGNVKGNEGQGKGIKDTPPLKKKMNNKNKDNETNSLNNKDKKDNSDNNEKKDDKNKAKKDNNKKKEKKTKQAVQPEDDDVDPDLKAELEALVRECAAANPEAMEGEGGEEDGGDEGGGEEGGDEGGGDEEVDIIMKGENSLKNTLKDTIKSEKKSTKRQPLRAATTVADVEEPMKIHVKQSVQSTQSTVQESVQQPSSSYSKQPASTSIESSSSSSYSSSYPTSYSDTKSACKDTSNGAWNFTVDYNDHFETPLVAYTDILPMLLALAKALGKEPGELVIYDPYYCQGGMVDMLKGMGFPKVVNRNRDFYADILMKGIPAYDILVTNPPYSGEHKPKLLKYLMMNTARRANNSAPVPTNEYEGRPFALLLPAYTATKSYWKEFVTELGGKDDFNGANGNENGNNNDNSDDNLEGSSGTGNGGGNSGDKNAVLYLLPPDSYEYRHPEGTGKDAPPFYSAWFMGGFKGPAGGGNITNGIRTALLSKPKTLGQIRNLRVLTTSDEMVASGIISDKRPNPKNRKKLIKARTGVAYVQSIEKSYSSLTNKKIDIVNKIGVYSDSSSIDVSNKSKKIVFESEDKEEQKQKKKRF